MTRPIDHVTLLRRLHATREVPDIYPVLCETAVELSGASDTALIIRRSRAREEVCVSSERASGLAEALIESGRMQHMDETTWVHAGTVPGVDMSVLAVPLTGDDTILGHLCFLDDASSGEPVASLDLLAEDIATHVAVALHRAQTEAGLREAIEGRHLIGIAQGRLMQRFDLDRDQAFAVLRRYSQDSNTKLRVVARAVAGSGDLPGRGPEA